MRIIHAKSYEDLSRKTAAILAAQVSLKPDSVLGLATGSTPVGTYRELARMYREGTVDFSCVRTVNLDEYVGLPGTHPQSYRYFMNYNLFDQINIDPANTHVPNGMAEDIGEECKRYDALVRELGVDMQLLGMGNNGHIGFNEPAEAFAGGTNCVALAENTIEANSRFFDHADEVPRKALTMGVGSIMGAKKILLVVSGAAKRDILRAALYGPVTPQVPGSILQFHPDVTVIQWEALPERG